MKNEKELTTKAANTSTEESINFTSETTNNSASFLRYLTVLSPVNGQEPSKSDIYKRTMELVTLDISKGELHHTIRMMLKMAGADCFLPPQYAKFQTVVLEGAVFVLTHMPLERIVKKLVDQIVLPMNSKSGERICTLVKDMPTLHKLSQIIGRSPGIDAEFKKSLIDLEDNISTVTYEEMHQSLVREIGNAGISLCLILEKNILAEASVCAVIAGTLAEKEQIVFKMVKPAIKKNMPAELALWGRLGDYLDTNKDKWGLGDFQFKGTINQVSWLLQNEIDLNLEQQNLKAVRDYYSSMPFVSIPEKLEISTPEVTVMTRLDGSKITDVEHLSVQQKRTLAKKITRLCVLQPIIDLNRESIFHGDPHAGNIAYRFENDSPEIIFYDWAMVGRLNRMERLAVMLMIAGLIVGNVTIIYYAADIMSGGKITADHSADEQSLGRRVLDIITVLVESREKRISGVLSSVESLIEQIMYQGVVFSSDLLVFEKSLVTLKGVLADIDSTFDRDEYVVWSAIAQIVSDVAHFRLQAMIIKEIWSLYKYSFSLCIDIQKTILRFGWEVVNAHDWVFPTPTMKTR
ncbi:MAG: hypothetical protein HQK67_10020, partial [Desulfamplus sp.]|nr:hypothetical protein [Desulfamplus sp.]